MLMMIPSRWRIKRENLLLFFFQRIFCRSDYPPSCRHLRLTYVERWGGRGGVGGVRRTKREGGREKRKKSHLCTRGTSEDPVVDMGVSVLSA